MKLSKSILGAISGTGPGDELGKGRTNMTWTTRGCCLSRDFPDRVSHSSRQSAEGLAGGYETHDIPGLATPPHGLQDAALTSVSSQGDLQSVLIARACANPECFPAGVLCSMGHDLPHPTHLLV